MRTGALYDVYNANCPTRLVLDQLADKWAMLVLGRLGEETLRFNVLRREIGVSQKVLSQTLKSLERDGLVRRVAYATVPVTVEYSSTPLGRTLTDAVETFTRWAEDNIETVLAAQRAYDGARGAETTPRA